MAISERLRQLRISLGFTQKEFATDMGIPARTYWRYEAEEGDPQLSFLELLIAKYGVSSTWLLTGEGKMFSKPMTGEGEAPDSPGEEIMEAVNEDPMIASIVRMLADMPPEKRQAAYEYVSEKKHLADLEKTVEALVAERTG
jgi:transcriptional regulator with XRE-family HTH domain